MPDPGSLAVELAARFGLRDVHAVSGGHQSQVFTAVVGKADSAVVVKVIDGALVDAALVRARVEMVAALADVLPDACRPLLVDGHLMSELPDGGLVTLWELAEGRAPDPADDGFVLGLALARLHAAMAAVEATGLPPVATYRNEPDSPSWQLLHGDFNTANIRIGAGGSVRVFDFDDCGRGPVEFDVSNAIYMVLFDGFVSGQATVAQTFRTSFLAGYTAQSGVTFPAAVIDREIARRIDALSGWLHVPETAPIGIRTASAEWKAVLRAFVTAHRH